MQFFKENSFIIAFTILFLLGIHIAFLNVNINNLKKSQIYLASIIEELNKKPSPMGEATDADIFHIKRTTIDSATAIEDIKCKILYGTGYSWSESYYGCEKVEYKYSK